MDIDSDVTLSDVVQLAIDRRLGNCYFTLPATIVSYDSGTQTAEVSISIDKIEDEVILRPPNIPDIPVLLPRNSKGGMSFMIESGDEVLLQFIQSSTGNWRSKAGQNPPDVDMDFDINDAVAIPCLYPREVGYEQREATEVMGDKVLVDAVESAQLTAPKLFLGDKNGLEIKTSGLAAANVSGVTPDIISILEGIVAALVVPWQTPTGPATPIPNVVTDLGVITTLLGQLKGEAE